MSFSLFNPENMNLSYPSRQGELTSRPGYGATVCSNSRRSLPECSHCRDRHGEPGPRPGRESLSAEQAFVRKISVAELWTPGRFSSAEVGKR